MPESLPPLTAEDIEGPLMDPSFSVYMYLGKEGDVGWENAELAFGLLARLRVYLVKDRREIRRWVGKRKPAGVVFGWGEDVHRFMTRTQADDFKFVLRAIREAQE